jgi:anti-anti-sigma factor
VSQTPIASLPPSVPNDAVVVHLSAPVLREEDVRDVGEDLDRLLTAPEPRTLVLDLEGVECPTAGGLARLVALQKQVQGLGGQLLLCNVGPSAYGVFELVRLTEVLDVRRPEAAHNP